MVEIKNKDQFHELIKGDKPVFVDFWAPWCGPCRTIAPVLDELSKEMDGKVIIAKVNIDDLGELATQFKVQSIPTMILFKNGYPTDKLVGGRPKAIIKDLIEKNL